MGKIAGTAFIAATVLTMAAWGTDAAQDWPTKPIRMLVGFGPGGGTDIAARFVGQPLSELLGEPVVIDNKPGVGGMLAADFVAKAAADGHTALMMSNAHAISAVMYKTVPYDPVRDFQMVSMVGTAGLVLIARKDFPADDVQGVIAAVKANAGKYNFGSSGVGTTQHFSGELLRQTAGLQMQHIPYRSAPAVVAGLFSNDVQLAFELIQAVQGQIHSGDVKAIAVTSTQRSPAIPDVPTFRESGVPDFDVTSWYGLAFPAGTPQAIVSKTNAAMRQLLGRADMQKRIADLAMVAHPSTPEELARHISGEIAKWQRVRDKAGIEPH